MADKKVIVHIGEDYVTGIVAKTFLDDDEIGGRNGDVFYDTASSTTLIWNGASWVAWEPNSNSNVGIETLKFGMASAASYFGPDIGYARKLETLYGSSDPLHIFKFAANASLGSDATIGTWEKDPTANDAFNSVYADMLSSWTLAKAALSSDTLKVQAIIISHGKADAADNDLSLAYEENLTKFIKDLRYDFLEDSDDDPIPVVVTKVGITGGNYDTIRDAQEAVANSMPYVVAIEPDTDHMADSSTDRQSGLGLAIFGNAIYDAIVSVSVEDDLETYNLASIKQTVMEEFGIEVSDTVQASKVTQKINEAILWIAKQRADWQWLLAETAVDVDASREESAVTLTQGSRYVTGLTAPIKLRDIVIGGEITGSQADGYMIESGSIDNGFRLQSKYLGETISASIATVVQGYFKMPRNFSRMQNCELIGANAINEILTYEQPVMFDKAKRQRAHLQGIATNLKSVYTVKPDPLGSDDLYVAVYPYPTDSRVMQCAYYKQPKKLVKDTDTPDLPRADRFVLLHGAFWFMAQYLKTTEDRLTFYRVQALQSLQALMENRDFSQEPNVAPNFDSTTPFIPMPGGYPNPGNMHA